MFTSFIRRVYYENMIDRLIALFFMMTSIFWWLGVLLFALPVLFINRKKIHQQSFLRTFYNAMYLAANKKFIWWTHRNLKKYIKNGDQVLDLGSGSGFLGMEIANHCNAKVTLCDVADFNQTILPLTIYDGEKLPFSDKQFDAVVISFVLHHCDKQIAVLKEAKRVCRKIVIICEDNKEGKIAEIVTRLHGIFFNWLAKLDTAYSFRSQAQWKKLFSRLGFKILVSQTGWRISALNYPVKECFFVLGV